MLRDIVITIVFMLISLLTYKFINTQQELAQLEYEQKRFDNKIKNINSNISDIFKNRKAEFEKNFDIINRIQYEIIKENDETNSTSTDSNITYIAI